VSPTFFSKSNTLFKSICEQDISGDVYDINILEDGIFTMGVTGFQLVTLEAYVEQANHDLSQLILGARIAV